MNVLRNMNYYTVVCPACLDSLPEEPLGVLSEARAQCRYCNNAALYVVLHDRPPRFKLVTKKPTFNQVG